jgi:hypothetical protein
VEAGSGLGRRAASRALGSDPVTRHRIRNGVQALPSLQLAAGGACVSPSPGTGVPRRGTNPPIAPRVAGLPPPEPPGSGRAGTCARADMPMVLQPPPRFRVSRAAAGLGIEAAGRTSSGRGSRAVDPCLRVAFLLLTASLNPDCSVSDCSSRCVSSHGRIAVTVSCARGGEAGAPPGRALRKLEAKPHTCELYALNLPRCGRIEKRNVARLPPRVEEQGRAERRQNKAPGPGGRPGAATGGRCRRG